MKHPYKKILSLFFFLPALVVAQKWDYQWPLGYDPHSTTIPDISLLDFTGDTVALYPYAFVDDLGFGASASFICDGEGQLQLLTNNCAVYDADFQLVPGSDSLTPGWGYNNYCVNQSYGGYPGKQSTVFLPHAGNDSTIFLLHKDNIYYNPDLGILSTKLYLSTLAKKTGRDAFIACFNSQNQDEWITYLGGSGSDDDHWRDQANGVAIDKYNRLYVVGTTNSSSFPERCPGSPAYCQSGNAGGFDAFISRFDLDGSSTLSKNILSPDFSPFVIYPNPSFGEIVVSDQNSPGDTFTLSLYNSLGQPINLQNSFKNCLRTCTVSMDDIPSGIYFIKILQNEKSFTQKLIKY